MLVLSRKVNEEILIGDDIKITLVRVRGSNCVSIGVDAPKEVRVLRSELGEKPRGEKICGRAAESAALQPSATERSLSGGDDEEPIDDLAEVFAYPPETGQRTFRGGELPAVDVRPSRSAAQSSTPPSPLATFMSSAS